MAAAPALAAEPDGLILPSGFHASVVAEGVGPIRHMAVRGNDIYVSTRHGANAPSVGIVACAWAPDHKAVETEHIAGIDQGTGIRVYNGDLYAATGTGVSRIALDDKLVPAGKPESLSTALPPPIIPSPLTAGATCMSRLTAAAAPPIVPIPTDRRSKPVGLKPCPIMETRGGVWRFSDSKPGQKLGRWRAFRHRHPQSERDGLAH